MLKHEESFQNTKDDMEKSGNGRILELTQANEILQKELNASRRIEDGLKESLDTFRSFVDSVQGIVFEAEPQTLNCTYISKQIERLLGYPTERWINEPGFAIRTIHPEDRDGVVERAYKGIQEQKPFDLELRLVAMDGRIVWVRAIVVVSVENNHATKLRGVAIDITQMKSDKEELERSLSLLKATLESTADGMLVVDSEGKMVSFNQKFIEMWRIPNVIIESKDDNEALAFVMSQLKDPEGFYRKVRALYSQPDASSYDVLEFIDGKIFERFSIPQRIGKKIVGRVWSFRDVTERKNIEEALKKQQQEQQIIFDSVPAMIWYKDKHNRILRCNRAVAATLGVTVEEMEGHTTEEFYPEEAAKYLADDLEVINSGRPKIGIIEPYSLASGEKRVVRTDKIPYRDENGNIIGVIVLAVDITDRHRAEEELKNINEKLHRISQMKSQFASMVSHELRTPLTVLKEGINLVLDGIDGPVTPAQIDTLSIAKDNVDRLARLINNVLDYEKLESGKLEMFFDKVNLNELVQGVYQFMLRMAQKKAIDFSLVLPNETILATCDLDKIQEVIINLIDNSIKYTERHGKIRLSLTRIVHDIRIDVEDSGQGIKKADQEKIFEMFKRSSEKEIWKIGGWGIGLAVCKMIIDLHRGHIDIDSEVGRGTKFSVIFPADLPTTQ